MATHIEKDDVSGTATTGHTWDGIKELNTPLPKWWLYTFYACVIWAIGYTILYPAWPLPGGAPSADVALILQPGHTEACVCLHHAPSLTLFTGDVLAAATPGLVFTAGSLAAFARLVWRH
jgi:hypothetical protein